MVLKTTKKPGSLREFFKNHQKPGLWLVNFKNHQKTSHLPGCGEAVRGRVWRSMLDQPRPRALRARKERQKGAWGGVVGVLCTAGLARAPFFARKNARGVLRREAAQF